MLPLNNTGSGAFDGAVSLRLNGALAVNGLAKSVHDPPNEILSHGNGDDLSGTLDGVTLLDPLIGAENNDGDSLLLQILGHAVGAVGEFHQFACHALVQSGGSGNAVTHQNDHTGLADLHAVFIIFDLVANDFCNFFRSQFHTVPAFLSEYGVFQQIPDGIQPVGHRVVQPLSVIVQPHAAHTCRVHPALQQDGLSGNGGKLVREC